GFIWFSCAPQYSQLCVPASGKLNTPFLPPAAMYCSWNVLFVRSVKLSRNFALKLSPAATPLPLMSAGLPLPQYTQIRVPLETSRSMFTIGSLRFHAGSLESPHMSLDL